jgi:hypothetical protein
MKINELLSTQQDIDEGIGSFLGKAAGHIAGATGAAWRDAKQGYKDAKAVWDPKDPAGTHTNDPATTDTATSNTATPGATASTGGTGQPYVAPAPAAARTAPGAAPTAPAPGSNAGNIADLIKQIDALDKPSKEQLAGELEKSIAATPEPAAPTTSAPAPAAPTTPAPVPAPAPQGQSVDLDQLKKDREAKLAAGQADQQQAQQQMAATKQANAATSQQDAAIKAAADAAKAKPPFQQTLSDKNAIKAAAAKGIKEAKKNKSKKNKKVVAEFHSNFLGKII